MLGDLTLNEELKRRLSQLYRMSKEGIFGEVVKEATSEYEELSISGIDIFLKVVADFYKPTKTEEDRMMFKMADLFCQLIIVVYREAKKQDVIVAKAFLNSFIKDFPGAQGSCVYPQWESLARASYAFKAAKNDQLLAWQQALKLVQANNEFLNVLLGYLIVVWRCASGKKFSPNVFNNPYGSKLNDFSQLTNGDNGIFYLIFRLAKPNLRNAIAHEDIWLDYNSNKVRFTDGKEQKISYEMDLIEFLSLAAVGSHLGQAYIAAISAILVLEEGSPAHLIQLPIHLVGVFFYQK